ncbi:MAG: sensor histidine kinase, partial [Candidatus Binatia bacterium]
PDDWRRAPSGVREGWYELRFHADPAAHPHWAVYLPSLSMNAAVHLNRRFLGDGGRFTEPVARNWSRPLLFPFAASLLSRDENTVHVRVRGDVDDSGLLGPVYVGSEHELAKAHSRRHALKITAVWGGMLGLVMVGIFTAALWAQSREETAYGWFAAASFAWAAAHLNLVVVEIPTDTAGWYGLWYVTLFSWIAFQIRFLLSFLGEEDRRVAPGLLGFAAVGSAAAAVLALFDSPWLHDFARLWLTIGLLASGYSGYRVVLFLRDHGDDLEAVVPHVLGASVIACAVHDWTVLAGFAGPSYDFYLPYAAPLMLLGMSIALLRRFVGALRQSESLVADLEARVRAKREELADSYHRLQRVERSRVIAAERERIMRDMHDGLGSHLVSTLSLIEVDSTPREMIARAVEAALDDLRLMVESLEPLDGDLLGALAMLRSRMQPRLEAAGIRIDWRVAELPSIPELGPHTVLQVLRILQEALTNVL